MRKKNGKSVSTSRQDKSEMRAEEKGDEKAGVRTTTWAGNEKPVFESFSREQTSVEIKVESCKSNK